MYKKFEGNNSERMSTVRPSKGLGKQYLDFHNEPQSGYDRSSDTGLCTLAGVESDRFLRIGTETFTSKKSPQFSIILLTSVDFTGIQSLW